MTWFRAEPMGVEVVGALACVGTAGGLLAFDFSDPLAPDLPSGVAAPALVPQTVRVQGRLVAACSTFAPQ